MSLESSYTWVWSLLSSTTNNMPSAHAGYSAGLFTLSLVPHGATPALEQPASYCQSNTDTDRPLQLAETKKEHF